MGFLLAEITLMVLISAASGAALSYWWTRRQYRDVTTEYRALEADLENARTKLSTPPLELETHEEPKPQSLVSPEFLASLLSKVEQAVAGGSDAQIARVMALEGQMRTLSRQLQDVLPHPLDGQDIARRLDTLGALMPQPKLNHVEARLGRLEAMVAGLCTQAGTEVPPVPVGSRLPSTPNNSRLPSSPSSTGASSPANARPSSPASPSSVVPGPPSSVPPRAPRPRRTEQV